MRIEKFFLLNKERPLIKVSFPCMHICHKIKLTDVADHGIDHLLSSFSCSVLETHSHEHDACGHLRGALVVIVIHVRWHMHARWLFLHQQSTAPPTCISWSSFIHHVARVLLPHLI
jgi:hypothetical protein